MCLAASERTILVDFRFILVDLEIQVCSKKYEDRTIDTNLGILKSAHARICTAPNKIHAQQKQRKTRHVLDPRTLKITTASSFVHAAANPGDLI